MAAFKIRKIKETDYEALARINTESLGYGYPVEKTKLRLQEALAQNKIIIFGVVDQSDNLVGYIHGEWYVTTYMDYMYNLLALAVLPQFKKQGLGRMLMEAFIKQAKDNGARGIRLSSGFERTDAHGFYTRMGFKMHKEQKNFRMEF